MSTGTPHLDRRPSAPWLTKVVEVWALGGGAILILLVLMEITSTMASLALGTPLKGAFELTEMGVAIAAFAFLPYCQMTGAHVSADIFTTGAGPRAVALFDLAAAVIALAIGLILVWRMTLGFKDYWDYEEVTAILGIPLWYAFVPIIASLALLCVTALNGLQLAWRRTRS